MNRKPIIHHAKGYTVNAIAKPAHCECLTCRLAKRIGAKSDTRLRHQASQLSTPLGVPQGVVSALHTSAKVEQPVAQDSDAPLGLPQGILARFGR